MQRLEKEFESNSDTMNFLDKLKPKRTDFMFKPLLCLLFGLTVVGMILLVGDF